MNEHPEARTIRVAEAPLLGDVGGYLARLLRLDPKGLVRLRGRSAGAGGDRITLWATPLGVLTRGDARASLTGGADTTVDARALLAAVEPVFDAGSTAVALPAGQDTAWRASLPPESGWRLVDEVPGEVVVDLAEQAASTVRSSPNPTIAGEALLDHPVLVVSGDSATAGEPADEVDVPLRVVQAAVRMGFLTPGDPVRVAVSGNWLAVSTPRGVVYRRTGQVNLLTLS